jgi:hypothetical protein
MLINVVQFNQIVSYTVQFHSDCITSARITVWWITLSKLRPTVDIHSFQAGPITAHPELRDRTDHLTPFRSLTAGPIGPANPSKSCATEQTI